MTPSIRVLLVDEHDFLLKAIRNFLGLHPDLSVVGTAADRTEAERQCRTLTPDVVVLDLSVAQSEDWELLTRLKAYSPQASIILFSAYLDPIAAEQATARGAATYVLKDYPHELIAAIRDVSHV